MTRPDEGPAPEQEPAPVSPDRRIEINTDSVERGLAEV